MEEKVLENQVTMEPTENVKATMERLLQDNMSLRSALQKMYDEISFKRLDYLFKVLECSYSFDEEFISHCAEEIKNVINPTEEEEE